MTLEVLVQELETILKIHPEAKDAQIWAYTRHGEPGHIVYVGYDRKHHPARIKLEDEK